MAICFFTCESRDGLELFCLYCTKIQFNQIEKNITELELRLRLPSTCENQQHTRQTSKKKATQISSHRPFLNHFFNTATPPTHSISLGFKHAIGLIEFEAVDFALGVEFEFDVEAVGGFDGEAVAADWGEFVEGLAFEFGE
jgi:hypothetical protein